MNKIIIQLTFLVLVGAGSLYLTSCSSGGGDGDEDPQPVDPCDAGPEDVEVTEFLHAFVGENSGSITVEASGGNGELMYSINGSDFNENNRFADLSPGEYVITVKDDSACTATLEYEVLEFPKVSFSVDVLPIIDANCQISPCHGTNQSLPSWSGYQNIKASAERIRFMVTEKFMPPPSSGGSLSDQQIATIRNWVDVGAPNN